MHAKSNGFTLIELLVVIGIFVVMTGVLLVSFQRGRETDAVRVAALRIVADIQRMQHASLAGSQEISGAVGYGIHFTAQRPDQYTLFADQVGCAPDAQGSPVCTANGRYDVGSGPRRDERLDRGVVVLPSAVRLSGIAEATGTLDIVFAIPRGAVAIVPDQVEARVLVRHVKGSPVKTITVNRISGRVNVE